MANDSACTGAATQDVSNAKPAAKQDCSDVIHISVFFDGTGNNKDVDEGDQKWSNPARIWRSARLFADQAGTNAYPIYVSGVGTPFNGKPLWFGDAARMTVEDAALGGATGAGGTRRLDFGAQQINDALKNALLNNAKTLGGKVAQYADAGKKQSFSEVSQALAKHRLIRQINVSIFGFSRGAALARAFCNQWLWQCSEDHGKLSYEGVPIRFCFLGLFDTVASFGLPSANASNWLIGGGFKGRDLVVDHRVERCVHYVAAHELRFSFPVDLIRRNGKLEGDWVERVYPGVHSDVGGGYPPLKINGKAQANRNNQGLDNNYARIPMRDMMTEASVVGVRIFNLSEIERINYPLFEERFECRPETEQSYQAYRQVCNPTGSVEQQVRKHMEQLYSAYGTLHRQGSPSLTQREHAAGQSWALGPDDMAAEIANYQKAQDNIEQMARSSVPSDAASGYIASQGLYAMWIQPAQWQMDAWKRKAAPGAIKFIDNWVHDSKVGFLGNLEPFSYFSKRGISESTHSVQGWFEENVVGPFGRAYDATADAVKETADYVGKKAGQAYDATAEAAKKTGSYVADKASQAYDATTKAASHAVTEGGKLLDEAGTAIDQATQDAVKSLKGAWQSLSGG